jgi:hypothetical protein
MSDPNLATAVAPTAATTAVVSSVAATTAVATVPAVVTPKRGGLHPTYGKFIGGAKLTDQYMLVPLTSGSYFRFFTQRRHEKTIGTIERDLREARDSTKSIKFNGTIDPTEGNLNEIGKERFIALLKKRVKEYGQQTFYWIRDSDGKVVDLFEHSHRFKLDNVVAEHTRRCVKNNDFASYDDIERDEVELSRTVVESLLTEAFQEKIEIRFNHRDDFDTLPGSCLFIMALETCNASVFHDIEGAKKKLEALDLSSYPGENVTEFASDAQKLIKVMQAGYSMPLNVGSSIVGKMTGTSSEFFNRKMWALLDQVLTAELEFELSDPKLFVKHKDYVTLGPLGIIATMQATHGMLLSQHRWTALAGTLPQGNNTPVTGGTDTPARTPSSALNGRRCFRCNGEHLVRDCPQPAPDATNTSGGTSNGNRIRVPLADWKYQKPTDITVPRVDATGKIWKFCTKCKCRATGKTGYYQLSHYTTEHRDNYSRARSSDGTGTTTTTAPPEVPPTLANAPQSNLTSIVNPNQIPPGPPDVTTREPDSSAHYDDELVFNGMWHTSVDASASTWVTVPFENKSASASTWVTVPFKNKSASQSASQPSPPEPAQSIWIACVTDQFVDSAPSISEVRLFSSSYEREQIQDLHNATALRNEDYTDSDVEFVAPAPSVSEVCSFSSSVERESLQAARNENAGTVRFEYSHAEYLDATQLSIVNPHPAPVYLSPSEQLNPAYWPQPMSEVPTNEEEATKNVSTTNEEETTKTVDAYNASVDLAPLAALTVCPSRDILGFPASFPASSPGDTASFFDDKNDKEASFLASFFDDKKDKAASFLSGHWVQPYLLAPLHWFWHQFFFYSFWLTTVLWDAVFYLLSSPRLVKPCRIRRKKNPSLSFAYPTTWMILTGCVMLLMSFFQGQVPAMPTFNLPNAAAYMHQGISNAHTRITIMKHMVDLNLGTLIQYQNMNFKMARGVGTFESPLYNKEQELSQELFPTIPFHQEKLDATSLKQDIFFETLKDDANLSFDPFTIHELCQVSNCVDCSATKTSDKIIDHKNLMVNGPTTPTQLLTDDTLAMLASDPYAFISIGSEKRQAVIFDTGASLGITFDEKDFDGPLTIPEGDLRLGGMASGLKIAGLGPVTWTFRTSDGTDLQIRSQCYHVPGATVRLLSPQRLFNKKKGVRGIFQGDEDSFSLQFEGCQRLVVDYDPRNHLPIGYATIGTSTPTILGNFALLDDTNQNLTAGHKLLLNWHGRFGHLNFPAVQRILRQFPFKSVKFAAAATCDLTDLRCEICQYAKAHRRTTHGKKTQPNDDRDGALKTEHLLPGTCVSVDHFESRVLGRTEDSYGKETSSKYKGGCIFVDHATGYIHVEHQLGFSAVETIRAKQNYESMAFGHGVIVQTYLTDSGAFKATSFVQHIREQSQKIQFCGTNAHHQNGVAERSIRTVSNMARAMLLHSAAHWKGGVDASIWPMAVSYAAYIYNNTPNAQNLCPADLYTGSMIPRHRLRDLHTWGCPVYVLDPTLQQGKKLPRWEPRSKRGVFVGLSTIHSSEVPMVLNLSTGSITTQYHVVFDDRFSTVESIADDDTPPTYWEDLCLENSIHVPTDQPVHLHDDFLTESERDLKYRHMQRQQIIRNTQHPTTAAQKTTIDVIASSSSLPSLPLQSEGAINQPAAILPPTSDSTPVIIAPTTTPRKPAPIVSGAPITPSTDPIIRRSTRENLGRPPRKYMDESYLTSVERLDQIDPYIAQLAYHAEVNTCCDTGIENTVDPRAYAAKTHIMDPDSPSFHQAMNGEYAEQYIQAMQLEVSTLIQQRTWSMIPRTPDLNVLKGTWVFKLKRLPDGSPSRFKARYCARGDLQQEGVDFFDTYAPVVQWSTIRMLLITVLTEGWATRQVDYTNAFAQADLREEVYLECPKMFAPKSGNDLVLKLIKSLYGLRQAPRTFFEKLRDGLLERGYVQSVNDPCLFMKQGIICVVYVDDTIFAGADSAVLEEEIRLLGVSDTEQRHTFQLRNEGEVGAFLGIQITKTGSKTFELKQTGLIKKVLETADMMDCNGVTTPTGSQPVGSDVDGPSFSESWKYRTVVGMLMYLAANTRPDIAFAVHQAARFSHAPKQSHSIAVKRILRYLKQTQDKGMIMTPTTELRVDCYVDSDFAGAFAVEHSQDPASVKSRTGYIIMYRGVPLLWVSKMQTQIALSTMEAEYIALSQSMRDLIPIRQLLHEIMTVVFTKPSNIVYHSHSKAFDDVKHESLPSNIEQSTVYEDNQACLKFARTAQLSPRTKHIGVPYHWFRSKVETLDIRIEPISTTKQLADPFTKGLSLVPFELSRRAIMGW